MKSTSQKSAIVLIAGALALGAVIFTAVSQYRSAAAALPPRTEVETEIDALSLAGLESSAVLGTGSMAPYIPAAPAGRNPLDTVVAYVAFEQVPFSALKQGDLVSYRWEGRNILHQLASRSGEGWIPSGLHNERFDGLLVTAANFRARVTHTYVIKNP